MLNKIPLYKNMSKHGKASVYFSLFVLLSGYGLWLGADLGFILRAIGGLLNFVLLIYFVLLVIELFTEGINKKYPIAAMLLIVFAIYNYWYLPARQLYAAFQPKPIYSGFCEHTFGGLAVDLYKDSSFIYTEVSYGYSSYYGSYTIHADTVIMVYEGKQPKTAHSNKLVYNDKNGLQEYFSDTSKKQHLHFYRPRINNLFNK